MMSDKNRKIDDLIREASKAMSNLNIFYAVVNLLETSISGFSEDANEIILLCKEAAHKKLKEYDKARASLRRFKGKNV